MTKRRKKETAEQELDVHEFIALASELDQLREKQGVPYRKNLFERLGGWYLNLRKRTDHTTAVNRKTYCRLCILGMFGVHHFYAKHWVKGLVYLLLCWTGISVAMAIVDWMIAVPKEADENGMIEI